MSEIEWNSPPPRGGVMGVWDRFVGPGATSAEEWVQVGFGTAIAAGCLVLFWLQGGFALGWLPVLVAVVLAADLGGGLVTNSTAAAKRWYHRPGHGRVAHLRFVAAHGVHIAAVAAVFPGGGWLYFAVAYAFLMAGATVIVLVPLYLQRPVAMGIAALGLLGAQAPLLAISALDWFLPLLLLKLLVAHLIKEAPFSAHQPRDAR